jgi:subtilase family serine protease
MNRPKTLSSKWSIAAAAVGLIALAMVMFGPLSGQDDRVLITQAIDETQLITLVGNSRPEAKDTKSDRGPVPYDFLLDHMLLQLKRSPVMEAELAQYIDQLTDKSSPNFHRWLTGQQIGEKYGPSQQDLDTIKSWLESKGFTVLGIQPNRMVMDISGTAAEIREAFHTEIHYLEINGETHFANMSDPKIPAALAPAVVGVVSMHNFKAHPMNVPRVDHPVTESDGFDSGLGNRGPNEPRAFYTTGNSNFPYTLVPADFQTIYNLVPLYKLGINGGGQTITVVEDTDTYSTDVATYRARFLSRWSGTVTTTHPTGANACTDPGATASDSEADIDAEVASAIAPNATIDVAACKDTTTTGVLLAIQNLVNAGSPPAIISMSYGECEALNGATSNAAFNTAFQTGAAAGVSIFASSGDFGASQCAPGYTNYATYTETGIGVTGWGETPYNVSVGGTDFEDTFNASKGTAPNNVAVTTYWNSTNSAVLGSAKSYIPEIPWNDSCAGEIFVLFESKTTGYGSSGACTLVTPSTAAGGGGPSGCATLTSSHASSNGVVDGTCTGYPKPSWQSGIFGNPADGVRDIPDVSMFASNGWWGHFVVICDSDTTNGGASCAGAPSTWSGFGGTSVASPIMASIQALVNEKWGTAWQVDSPEGPPRSGNPAPTYYQIANAEFGSGGNSACYSINQLSESRRGIATSCAFYDITQGDNNIDCEYNGTIETGCYKPSGTYGALSTQTLATTGTVTAGGSGYTSAPTCTLGKPSDLYAYSSPSGTQLWAGGTAATCTATISGGAVTAITVSSGSTGYAGGTSCTLTGGGGSGATCSASPIYTTAPSSWQPAYGATPGWDFATGIGSVNAYNLVLNGNW